MASKLVSFAVGAVALALVFPFAASAAPEEIGSSRDWTAFKATEATGVVCYALTAPTDSRGDYSNRGPIYLMVTRRPAEGVYDEVSAITGYSYKDGSRPEIKVGDRAFKTTPVGEVAWPLSRETPALVRAMRGGSDLVLTGTSTRGTDTRDTFSLFGFTAMLKAIGDACPKR